MKLSYRLKRQFILGLFALILLTLYLFRNASQVISNSFVFLNIIGAFLFIVAFYALDHWFDLRMHVRHYVFITLISIASILLSPLYFISTNYDKILHLIQPMMLGSIVFHLVRKLPIKLRWQLTYTFFVVIGITGLFEIGEYLLDVFFDMKLQGVFFRDLQLLEKFDLVISQIDDTMIDMIFGVIGVGIYILFLSFISNKRLRKSYPKLAGKKR